MLLALRRQRPGKPRYGARSASPSPAPLQAFAAREFWERAVTGDREAIDNCSLLGRTSRVDVAVGATPTRAP